jgi:hypothetical protein
MKPWDLLEMPVGWYEIALMALSAENHAANQKEKRGGKRRFFGR